VTPQQRREQRLAELARITADIERIPIPVTPDTIAAKERLR
jgi:hypothetical protein